MPRLTVGFGAIVLAFIAPACDWGSPSQPAELLVLVAAGGEDGAIVEVDGIEAGKLARLPAMTGFDRLVLRLARYIGILDVNPNVRVPSLCMLKISLKGISPGVHSVTVRSPTGKTYDKSFTYPDQLRDGVINIPIDHEALARELFGEGEPCDQQPPRQESSGEPLARPTPR